MTSITGRLIKGSMWLSLSRAIVNGLATLSTFVLAWYLAPSDFGLVALGTTMLLIVTTVTELSLAEALIRHEAPNESHFSAAWTLNATRGLLLCVLFAACAYPASALFEEPRLFGVMLALGFGVLLGGLDQPAPDHASARPDLLAGIRPQRLAEDSPASSPRWRSR